MKSLPGRWVTDDDFFDRTDELDQLESMIRNGTDVLLTGQRRMGKTSVARELGLRLQRDGWAFIFASLEGARDEGDAVTSIASAAYDLIPASSRLAGHMSRWLGERAATVEEIGAYDFSVRLRASVTKDTWRRQGRELVHLCAQHSSPVLLVLDELPIFLAKLLKRRDSEPVDDFLSWLRETFQLLEDGSPALLISGSIGLVPLVQRLGIPDRINYLHTVRLGPWSREISVECFERLAGAYQLSMEEGAADAAYDRLGIGIPQHVQSFFARLRDFPAVRERGKITVEDVDAVYGTEMLGPTGQGELFHYESRLRDALGDARSHEIAAVILAEAATQTIFAQGARQALERLYADQLEGGGGHIDLILDILVHDGYLERSGNGYRFPAGWLKDRWSARSVHHVPLESRKAPQKHNRIGY